jgi:hypothetical protein
MVLVGAYGFVTDSATRQKVINHAFTKPGHTIYSTIALLMLFGFFAGVFIHPLGNIRLFGDVKLWQFCGIGMVLSVFVPMILGKEW